MHVNITSPRGAGGSIPVVGRPITVTGTYDSKLVGGGRLRSFWIEVQFGGGPVVDATFQDGTWHCTGQPPASVRGTDTFTVRATTMGTYDQPGDGVFGAAIDHISDNVTLRMVDAVPPQLTVNPVPPDLNAAQLPFAFMLTGTATDQDSNIASVVCAVDTGPFVQIASGAGPWQLSLGLSEGLHRFIVRATDAGGHQVETTLFTTVHPPVAPVDPGTESITSWTRLEPHCRDAEMGKSVSARLFDPLWLMARQWQLGEFQAVDGGTPVQARVRATNATLSRYVLGESVSGAAGQPYDPSRTPLEAVVERCSMRPADANDPSMLTLAVEAGLHFLRMLDLQAQTNYRGVLTTAFVLPPVAGAVDDATRRFVQSMSGRAPDARRLAAAFRATGGIAQTVADPALQIAPADRPAVERAAIAWLTWYDGLFAEPGDPSSDAWDPSRMEYALSVAASLSGQVADQVGLSATGFNGGRLDWSSFDTNPAATLGSSADHTFAAVTETAIPAPVSVRGAPAIRFWELEDSRIAYGLVPVGPTDLAHLMLIEYAGSYGNDWFTVPLTLPVGSVTRVDSLVVTDSFGVRTLLKPLGGPGLPAPFFSMWQQCAQRRPGEPWSGEIARNLFFLPPSLGRVIESGPLEDVLFMRDEMANIAWAIERSIESPVEQALPGTYAATSSPAVEAAPQQAGAPSTPRYLLASAVPENWIPFLPVQLSAGSGRVTLRLKRGAVLQPDGSAKVHHARGEILDPAGQLLLYDAEVPREGVRVSRSRRMARWTDGSTWVWSALRKGVGRGEGSSNLQFDTLAG